MGAPMDARPRRSRRKAGDGAAAKTHWIEVTIFALCIFLLTSPFTYTLISQDPNVAVTRNLANMRQEENSQWLLYAVRAGVLVVAAMFMLRRWRRVIRSLRELWPILPLAAWAAMSIIWSDDPAVTAHSVAALISLTLATYLIALRLTPQYLGRAVILAGAMLGICSLLYVLLLPGYGVHQHTDATQAVHAGAWRGIFIHKNFLGQTAAFFAAATFWAGPQIIGSKVVKWGLFLFLTFLIIMSTSASAIALLPLTILLVWATMGAGPKMRLQATIWAAPVLVAGYLSTGAVLEALGRDTTFSGRDVVWNAAFESFQAHPMAGYGFVSITYGEFSYNLMMQTGLFDPHNAFFDIALGTGAIGLAFFLILIAFSWMAGRRLVQAGGMERQIGLILFSVLIGWLISDITEANDRPFSPMGALGYFAMVAMLALPRPLQSERKLGSSAGRSGGLFGSQSAPGPSRLKRR